MNLEDEFRPAKVIYTKNDDTMSALAVRFLNQGKHCLCFLRGAPRELFTQKLLCALAGVAREKAQDGTIDAAEWAQIFAAANRLARGDVQIDSGAVSDEEISVKCKNLSSADVVLILPLAE